MPTTLTGSSAGIADGDAVSVASPADGDPRNAASVDTPLQYLLHRAKYLLDFVAKTHTWTLAQTFTALATLNGGAFIHRASAITPHIDSNDKPPGAQDRFLIARWKIHSGGAPWARLYGAETGAGGAFELSINAAWDGSQWVADSTQSASIYRYDGVEFLREIKAGATAAGTWTTWDTRSGTLTLAAGHVAGTGDALPKWYLDANGLMHIQGKVGRTTNGTGSTTPFAAASFPSTYYPASNKDFPCLIQANVGLVATPNSLSVKSDGSIDIRLSDPSDTFFGDATLGLAYTINLDGVTWKPAL